MPRRYETSVLEITVYGEGASAQFYVDDHDPASPGANVWTRAEAEEIHKALSEALEYDKFVMSDMPEICLDLTRAYNNQCLELAELRDEVVRLRERLEND